MQFTSTILALGALVVSTMAAPVAEAASSKLYYLQVSTNDTRFDKMYLSSYHTGAGFADVVLSTAGDAFFTNGSKIESNIYGNGTGTGLSLSNGVGTTYDDWYPVVLDAGDATSGFTYSAKGGVNSTESYFQGWLVCKWAHGSIPQLFYLVLEYPTIPGSCSKVDLLEVPTSS